MYEGDFHEIYFGRTLMKIALNFPHAHLLEVGHQLLHGQQGHVGPAGRGSPPSPPPPPPGGSGSDMVAHSPGFWPHFPDFGLLSRILEH